jgi:hypothetical protein
MVHDQPKASRLAAMLCLAVMVGLALVSCSPQPSAPGSKASGPRLVFDQTEVDFGKVPFNKTVEHAFVYRNVGTAPVSIIEKPSIETVEGC